VADVRVITAAGRPGLAETRNAGLAAARSDVVAFLDDDAVAEPGWIERLVAPYHDPCTVAVGGAAVPVWEAQRPRWMPAEFDWVVGCSYLGMPTQTSSVRNLIGCNMSFRRDAAASAGGFAASLGRVGTRPLGCEETDLCIRLGPGVIVYDPEARVHHRVPRDRATWRYFVARCHAEGLSKAQVTRRVGRSSGLASERAHAARTLPAGVYREMRTACVRRSATPLSRAAAIVVGLAVTLAGYVWGSARA